MTNEARLHWEKAQSFHAQAARLSGASEAEAVIHLSYYAMYHAAIAVLIDRSGSAPVRHTGVIGQFGLVVRGLDDEARSAGRLLNAAFDTRVVADYDVGHGDLGRDAEGMVVDSGQFLGICARLFAQAP